MQFIVLGFDGADAAAPARRLAMRPRHLEQSVRMYAAGRWLFSSAILDEEGAMVGSMIVCDFASREVLEDEWLRTEPYVTGNVWERFEVHRAAVSPRALERVGGS